MEDIEYFLNKRPHKTYISKAIKIEFEDKNLETRNLRIISKVIDSKESISCVKIKNEVVIRLTEGQREELIARIYEDTRGIHSLTFQKFTTRNGNPHKLSFTFVDDEISKLISFLSNINHLPFNSDDKYQITDSELDEILLSKEQTRKILIQNKEVLLDLLKNDITKEDIISLGYRKEQLNIFEMLLCDKMFFEDYRIKNGLNKPEAVWQSFFEKNVWIFGYGLNYIFTTNLPDKKLEQVIKGYDFTSSGKRVDALLKTKSLISALCFVEIKRNDTPLLSSKVNPYRADCWAPSEELSGAICQIQKTVQKAVKSIETRTMLKDKVGNPIGEEVFLYSPKSYILIGSLTEFKTDCGVNEEKYSSFEIYRQSFKSPEIITFDELFERANYIVKFTE